LVRQNSGSVTEVYVDEGETSGRNSTRHFFEDADLPIRFPSVLSPEDLVFRGTGH